MIRLVLFDIDGTLVHTGGAGVRAFRQVFASEFNAADGFERLKFAGRTDVSLVREFFSVHNIPATPANFERFFATYVFWLDHILTTSQTRVCPGVWECLQALNSSNPRPVLGLLTGNIQLGAEIKLRHFGLWEVFQVGGFADDHEDRAGIAKAARNRGCKVLGKELAPEEVLVIGDTHLDIACGRAIGAKVLAVGTGGAKLEDLRAHRPDWLAASLDEVDIRDLVKGR